MSSRYVILEFNFDFFLLTFFFLVIIITFSFKFNLFTVDFFNQTLIFFFLLFKTCLQCLNIVFYFAKKLNTYLGCVCFLETGFQENTLQTFMCLFAIKKVGQRKILSSQRKNWLGFQESVFLLFWAENTSWKL
jgi:hypothetical protein